VNLCRVFVCIALWFYLGRVPVLHRAWRCVCCANFLWVPCLRIRRGYSVRKCHQTLGGLGVMESWALADTCYKGKPFCGAHEHEGYLSQRINQFCFPLKMCVHTLPILDDNPPQHINTALTLFHYKCFSATVARAVRYTDVHCPPAPRPPKHTVVPCLGAIEIW